MRHKLTYSSLFAYCPKSKTEEGWRAREFRNCLKNNWPIGGKSPPETVALTLKKILQTSSSLRSVFHSDVILVPVPRSSPIRKGDLWPSFEIAKEMQNSGLGRVLTPLERVERVNPSSRSRPEDRPTPTKHFQSLSITKRLTNVDSFVLVDDIVTRGHTFMGCAWKIEEAYPNISIRAFAAIRTISNVEDFRRIFDPVELGNITYRQDHDDCIRRP